MALMSDGQFLTFVLNKDSFAVDIHTVKEVLDFVEPTQVPRSPDFFLGIVNLRGEMLPVLDMRIILDYPDNPITEKSCFIVTDIFWEGEPMTVGLLADSVHQVIAIDGADIKPPPKMSANVDVDFLTGIGTVDEHFVMLLNMNKVLGIDELHIVDSLSSQVADSFIDMVEDDLDTETTSENTV